MGWMLTITIALYSLGLLHSIFGFYQKRQIFVRIALGMVAFGFLFHTLFLVVLGTERQHFPITNLPESLSFFAWCISLTFMVANFRYKINALGAFILPLVSLLTIVSQVIWEENHSIPSSLRSGWVYFHSSIAFLAYAAFFFDLCVGHPLSDSREGVKGKEFPVFIFPLTLPPGMRRTIATFAFCGLLFHELDYYYRSLLGTTGMGQLLELGSQRNRSANHLGNLFDPGELPPFV